MSCTFLLNLVEIAEQSKTSVAWTDRQHILPLERRGKNISLQIYWAQCPYPGGVKLLS